MEHESLFQTLAQVAATFAGFAAIIGVFQGGRGRAGAIRVRDVVEVSIIVTLLSLLPFLVFGYGAGEPLVWQICCAIGISVGTIGFAGSLIRGWSVWRTEIPVLIAIFLAWVIGTVYIVFAVVGRVAADMAFMFLLTMLLGIAGFMFLRVLLPPEEAD